MIVSAQHAPGLYFLETKQYYCQRRNKGIHQIESKEVFIQPKVFLEPGSQYPEDEQNRSLSTKSSVTCPFLSLQTNEKRERNCEKEYIEEADEGK